MSDANNAADRADDDVAETGTATARIRRTPWRGWLLAVPLAALILVGYLVIRTWLLTGPTVTVTFPESEGIGPQGTVVKYKGLQVGSVTAVSLADDLAHVKATLEMNSAVADALNSGTRFWIVSPSILSGNVSSLLSGAYIAMRPGQGSPQKHFEGTLGEPEMPPDEPGQVVTLYADDKGGLAHGSVVEFRGLAAGNIVSTHYDPDVDRVRVRAFIKKPYAQHLNARTRFWRIGKFGVSTGGSGLAVRTPSIKPLIKGGVAFADVASQQPRGPANGDAGQNTYQLYASRTAAEQALAGTKARFSLDPRGSLNGLATGAPVTLAGVRVGRVVSTRVQYDPAAHAIATAATIAIYAAPLGIASDRESGDRSGVQVTNAVNDLVKHGLRARLASSSPVLGGEQVVLTITDRDSDTGLDRTREPPGIPTTTGSGIDELLASAARIASKINAVPIDDIGRNLARLAANARRLSGSPEIDSALDNLNHSLANVEAISARANGQVEPLLQSLRGAAKAAESAAERISRMTGGPGANQASIEKLVSELTRTARSIRVLTTYLQSHPEALLRGR